MCSPIPMSEIEDSHPLNNFDETKDPVTEDGASPGKSGLKRKGGTINAKEWEVRVNCSDTKTENPKLWAEEKLRIETWLKTYAKQWVFQLEQGLKGIYHWQIAFKTKKGFTEEDIAGSWQRNKWTMDGKQGHVARISRKGMEKHAGFSYCMKFGSILGPYRDKKETNWTPEQKEALDDPMPWQTSFWESLERREYEGRRINVVQNQEAGGGKSMAIDIAEKKYEHIYDIPAMKNAEDVMAFTCSLLLQGEVTHSDLPVLVFDFPFHLTTKKQEEYWQAIEQLKNGKFSDKRNKAHKLNCRRPIIWVFCNHPPPLATLAPDRWTIYKISENFELINITPTNVKTAKPMASRWKERKRSVVGDPSATSSSSTSSSSSSSSPPTPPSADPVEDAPPESPPEDQPRFQTLRVSKDKRLRLSPPEEKYHSS